MELFEEILLQKMKEHFLLSSDQIAQTVELECYNCLKKIKAIIEDDSLDDPECFMKIEKIICAFEDIGSTGGFRHDFS